MSHTRCEFRVDFLDQATYAEYFSNGANPPTRRGEVLLYGASADVWGSCLAAR
jgi:hypothetical protein